MGGETGQGSESGIASAEIVDGLNDLLQLDHDALASYEIAIERLENRQHALQIEGFKKDHERHIRDLNEIIISFGGIPRNEPHPTAPLKEAIQRIAAAGGDTALLVAWRANELHVTTKYDGYARKAVSWPSEAKRVVDENALDEERHYQWAVAAIGGGDPELRVASRMREELDRARLHTRSAQGRLREITEGARRNAASGLETAAARLERLTDQQATEDGVRGHAAVGAQRLARGFDAAAGYLRGGGEGRLQAAIEKEVRSSPARSLAAIFTVGFVLGRILR